MIVGLLMEEKKEVSAAKDSCHSLRPQQKTVWMTSTKFLNSKNKTKILRDMKWDCCYVRTVTYSTSSY